MRIYKLVSDTNGGTDASLFTDHALAVHAYAYMAISYAETDEENARMMLAVDCMKKGIISPDTAHELVKSITDESKDFWDIDTVYLDYEDLKVEVTAYIEGGVLHSMHSNVSGIAVDVFDFDNKEQELNAEDLEQELNEWRAMVNKMACIF